jgi:SAM-dependent methyltransferase
MALSALLPALMAERHERCFVIGWGTGVTAGELAALEETRQVLVAEISRGVLAAAPLFDAGNLAASKNPKVELRLGDAYRTLLQSPDRYDLIISEPSNPWVTGVEMLYSREFLEAARSRLRPGGVYAQWFYTYETDVEVVELVLRTYAEVFPHVSVWFTLGYDLLLLGFDRPDRALDVRALAQRFGRRDFAEGFAREGLGIDSFPQLLAHELLPLGTLHAAELPGEIHSLRHPILSHRAARAFFVGRQAWLPPFATEAHERVASRNSLLRRFAISRGSLPEDVLEIAARETCRFSRHAECATFFASWGFDHPGSPLRRSTLTEVRSTGKGRNNPYLTPANLAGLQALFGGSGRAVPDGAFRMQAERMTDRFLRHYHHAVPFDRDVLEAAWSRCRGDKCEERRRLAEQRVGWTEADSAQPEGLMGAGPRRAPELETLPPDPYAQTQGVWPQARPE